MHVHGSAMGSLLSAANTAPSAAVLVLSPDGQNLHPRNVRFFFGCGLPKSTIILPNRRAPIYLDIEVFGMEEMQGMGIVF